MASLNHDLPPRGNPKSDSFRSDHALKAPEENPIPKARSSKRADKLTEAIKNSPLAILERAWEEAEENERSIFLKRIGA